MITQSAILNALDDALKPNFTHSRNSTVAAFKSAVASLGGRAADDPSDTLLDRMGNFAASVSTLAGLPPAEGPRSLEWIIGTLAKTKAVLDPRNSIKLPHSGQASYMNHLGSLAAAIAKAAQGRARTSTSTASTTMNGDNVVVAGSNVIVLRTPPIPEPAPAPPETIPAARASTARTAAPAPAAQQAAANHDGLDELRQFEAMTASQQKNFYMSMTPKEASAFRKRIVHQEWLRGERAKQEGYQREREADLAKQDAAYGRKAKANLQTILNALPTLDARRAVLASTMLAENVPMYEVVKRLNFKDAAELKAAIGKE